MSVVLAKWLVNEVVCAANLYLRQKSVLNKTKIVNNSNRPISIANVRTHLLGVLTFKNVSKASPILAPTLQTDATVAPKALSTSIPKATKSKMKKMNVITKTAMKPRTVSTNPSDNAC